MEFYRASRGIPQRVPESQDIAARSDGYGNAFNAPLYGSRHFLADEGSYFVATNPTPGTPIAITTSITTFAETAGAVGVSLLLKNNDSRTGNAPKRIYFDKLKLMIVQVPTSATSWQFALVIDDNPVRYTSGGSAITPTQPNGDSNIASVAQMYFGALTTAVPNNRRTVGRGTLRGVIPTTFDEFIITSGGMDEGGSMASAAASGRIVENVPPIILAPQQQLCLTMWGAANAAAPTFEFEATWWEK
jgi:hypothetical protein